MNARTYAAAALAAMCFGTLPAWGADPGLMKYVMPDAKVVAGANVDSAKASPFGQYVLSQIAPSDSEIQKLQAMLGLDPRRDVKELLVASTVAGPGGLVLARGFFDVPKITAAATAAGAISEAYQGTAILEDPKQKQGVAFPDGTTAVAGDIATVKAALDRAKVAAPLPAGVTGPVNYWSGTQDAWVVALVPPNTLKMPVGAPSMPNLTQQTAFQAVQQAAAGVKYGTNVVLTVQAQTDTAQNATSMAGVVQLLVNLGQAQAQSAQNGSAQQAADLLKSLVVKADGNLVNLTLSLPEPQFEQLLHPKRTTVRATPRRGAVAK